MTDLDTFVERPAVPPKPLPTPKTNQTLGS
jgi:hypothetical protein